MLLQILNKNENAKTLPRNNSKMKNAFAKKLVFQTKMKNDIPYFCKSLRGDILLLMKQYIAN